MAERLQIGEITVVVEKDPFGHYMVRSPDVSVKVDGVEVHPTVGVGVKVGRRDDSASETSLKIGITIPLGEP